MTIYGSCLCGSVKFQFEQTAGPFEICHCTRCRKLTGAQGMPAVTIRADGYAMTEGSSCISTYEAPILYSAPAYRSTFCAKCGSPVPDPSPKEDTLEVPAGLLDGQFDSLPDKHIFVEFLPAWDSISDGRPQYDIRSLAQERSGSELPDEFRIRTHYDQNDDK